jgi:hypothetical protein
VTLSWAPEFEPGSADEGKALLKALAALTGGVERLAMAGLFSEAEKSAAPVPLAPALVVMAVLLLIAEVFTRRFFASGAVRKRVKPIAAVPVTLPSAPRTVAAPVASPPQPRPSTPEPPPPPEEKKPDMASALEAARAKARKRTGR